MAIGEGLFSAVPNTVWVVVHAITALVGLYYLTKSRSDSTLMWVFILYVVSGVLFVLVHLGQVDMYTTHILESVFMFIAIILIGTHAVKCCR